MWLIQRNLAAGGYKLKYYCKAGAFLPAGQGG
jgi:hypothetical protein